MAWSKSWICYSCIKWHFWDSWISYNPCFGQWSSHNLLQNNVVLYKSPHTTHLWMGWLRVRWRMLSINLRSKSQQMFPFAYLTSYKRIVTRLTLWPTEPGSSHLLQAPRSHLSKSFLVFVIESNYACSQLINKHPLYTVCKFQVGDAVLVHDLWPSAPSKWLNGKLLYLVSCEGHQRQVHIDQI